MNYTIHSAKLQDFNSYWKSGQTGMVWPSVFVLPPWLESWWSVFGAGAEEYIRVVKQGESPIGIAPFKKIGDTISFIGDVDVCDYEDFVLAGGRGTDFFNALLGDLENSAVKRLELKHLRPDSAAMTQFIPLAGERGHKITSEQEDVSVEMALPAAWEGYLESLNAKQRHEVRRKLRRLQESGNMEFVFIKDAPSVPGAMDNFFKMFTESRRDKAAFLTEKREEYFRLLAGKMAAAGLLKLGILKLDGQPVAQIICFDYNDVIYLYNSGYDPDYVSLSAGLLSKVLAIKNSIENGKRRFDFLKGSEIYKYHLGGKEVPLYKCVVELK